MLTAVPADGEGYISSFCECAAAVRPEGAVAAVPPARKNHAGRTPWAIEICVSHSLMYYLVICLLAHIVTLSHMVSIRMGLAKINIYFLLITNFLNIVHMLIFYNFYTFWVFLRY